MTTISAGSVSANPIARSWNVSVSQTISAATPLYSAVAGLVAGYLPSIDGWITEWAGERGREIVSHAVAQAETPLTHGLVNLIIQYLKKSDIFGLADVEKAAGGKKELTRFLGKYNAENPLPLEIDDEMQENLGEIFSNAALGQIPGIRKVTELFSLYWCPEGITANIAEKIAKKHGQHFTQSSYGRVLREHGDAATTEDSWIQFPNDVFGRDKQVWEQVDLVPAGFEFPHFTDAVFCVFMKYLCAREQIMVTFSTRCREWTRSEKLTVGGFHAGGLFIGCSGNVSESLGVAVVRKLLIKG